MYDRAVFHFLTTDEDHKAYVKHVLRALKPGGHISTATILGTLPTLSNVGQGLVHLQPG